MRVHLNERDVPYMKPEKKKVVKFQLEKEWKWLEFHRKIFREGVIIDAKWNSKVAALLRNNWEMLQRSRVTVTQKRVRKCHWKNEQNMYSQFNIFTRIYLQEFLVNSKGNSKVECPLRNNAKKVGILCNIYTRRVRYLENERKMGKKLWQSIQGERVR